MQVRSVKLALALLLVVCVGSSLPAWAQLSDTGTVVGRVTDATGAVVVGASVTLTDTSTSTSHTAVTNDAGRYTFANVKPGIYNISISKVGFSTTKTEHQEVKVGTTLTVDLGLQVGGATTVVEVTAVGTELQTMDATVGQTITGDALDSLPGLGRDVSTFVTLQPGVAPDGSVAGGNQDQNSFMLDGGNNSSDMDGTQNTYTASFAGDPTGGLVNQEVTGRTSPAGSPGGGGPTGVMPTPADSIEEFRVGTNNQTADFNSSAGAEVKLVTKRGSNQWHGTAYEYYLDNNWGANSFDNNFHAGTTADPKIPLPSYHYSRFGGSIGGPLLPKEFLGGKTFFFANYEGFHWPNSATIIRATPSPDMRLGLLTDVNTGIQYNLNPYDVTNTAGTLVPANNGCAGFTGGVCDPQHLGISPTIQALWTSMPKSNASSCLGLLRCDAVNVQAFTGNYAVKWRDDFGVARLDHDFGSKWHFYTTFRYYHQRRDTANQINIAGGTPVSDATRPSVPWYYTASLTTNISNNVTNDFHYSFLRNWWSRSSLGDPTQVAGLGGALEPMGEDAANVLAPINLDTQDVRTRFWDGKDHMFRDDVSWVKGTHFFTFGGLYQHNWNYHQRTDNGGGINYQPVYWLGRTPTSSLNGMNMAGFEPAGVNSRWVRDYGIILGAPSVDQIAYIRAGTALNLQTPVGTIPASDKSVIPFYNLYFNDSWRMKPNLTVSYGLGWTLEMPPKEEQGKQIAFVDNNDKIIDTAAYLKARETAALSGNVFNPNVGFALIGNVAGHPSHFYNPFYKSFSPRMALAWNPKFDSDSLGGKIFGHDSTVVRGGYSILYGRLNGVGLVLLPLLGTGLIQAVQCISPLNDGVTCAGSSGSTPANSFRIGPTAKGFGGLVAPIPAGSPTLPQPDFVGINALPGGAGSATDINLRPSMNQEYDLTIQRQLNNKMSLEIGYIGRHITHEFQPVNINAVPYMMTLGGQRFDKAYGQMVMQYCGGNAGLAGGNCAGTVSAVTAQPFFEAALGGPTSKYCNIAGASNCTQAVAINEGNNGTGNIGSASVWSLWSDLDGGSLASGTPRGFVFPRSMLNTPLQFDANGVPLPCTPSYFGCSGQLTSGVGENTSLGYGNYNALFFSYKMSAWHGLSMQSNFTWSKSLGTGSQVQATSQYTANDPYDLSRSYGYQPWDRKFMFNTWFTYTPEVYKGQHGLAGHLLGGWTFAPILDVGSGIPATIGPVGFGSSVYTGGQEFGATDGGNIGSNTNAVNICGNRSFSTSRHDHFVTTGGFGGASPANMFADPGAVYNCFRNPILGIDNGHNGGVGNLRGQAFWNVDFSLKKKMAITERFGAEFGAVFTNVFNHVQLSDPGLTFVSDKADFGALESALGGFQIDAGRKIEIDFRLKF